MKTIYAFTLTVIMSSSQPGFAQEQIFAAETEDQIAATKQDTGTKEELQVNEESVYKDVQDILKEQYEGQQHNRDANFEKALLNERDGTSSKMNPNREGELVQRKSGTQATVVKIMTGKKIGSALNE